MRNKMKKIIFTFWEPKNNIPDYVQLCIDTWRKNLPDYKIIILNYGNLNDYITTYTFTDYFKKNFSLAKQADAIRALVLAEHGGIWLDADTIVLSGNNELFKSKDYKMIMYSYHIGSLKCKKDSIIIQHWAKEVKNRIKDHEIIKKQLTLKEKMPSEYEAYCYLGNSPINELIRKHVDLNDYEIKQISGEEYNKTILEGMEKLKTPVENYKNFYFYNNRIDYVLEKQPTLIMLHNSWTPIEFKNMNKKEFLSHDNTITNIFKYIFNIRDKRRSNFYKNYINISERKTAYASSCSEYYNNNKNAKNVLVEGKLINNDFAFHTAIENYPYIIIDLEKQYNISKIEIKNRNIMHRKRALNLEILVSEDNINYDLVAKNIWQKNILNSICLDYADINVNLKKKIRFVKFIINEKQQALHLSKINIYTDKNSLYISLKNIITKIFKYIK